MDSSDSGIFRLASVGSYLDALSSITAEMSLKERSDLIHLDKSLHRLWKLGQNVILCWCAEEDGISLVVVPHYAVAEFSHQSAEAADGAPRELRPSADFFEALLSGRRQLNPRQMDNVVRLLGVERTRLPLRAALTANPAHEQIIEKMIKRYSITYVPCRAVALFDIVGFSLLSPFEQMTQLNSLSYSLNAAQSKLLDKKIGVDFARSTTGDGFYVWNRDLDLEANVNLYHLMYLVLADNAIARRKAERNTVPRLRAGFHIGSSYEFHQSEGLNPTLYHYIVGDVTVELARMIDYALPHQILVGDFHARLDNGEEAEIGAPEFVARATQTLSQLKGLELSGERVESIKSYLTGTRLQNGEFTVRRITVNDKHGISRQVFNAKANIYRRNAAPILLGIEDRLIEPSNMPFDHTEHLLPVSVAH
ncbi:MAG: hypothetical protein JXB36_19070 [Gammaproteobacteria bacterium]|nr:hypothetical protein [Gammaproteobacteria bacterium]